MKRTHTDGRRLLLHTLTKLYTMREREGKTERAREKVRIDRTSSSAVGSGGPAMTDSRLLMTDSRFYPFISDYRTKHVIPADDGCCVCVGVYH